MKCEFKQEVRRSSLLLQGEGTLPKKSLSLQKSLMIAHYKDCCNNDLPATLFHQCFLKQ